jgi:hypothetical protein
MTKEDQQHIITTVAHSGASLILTLTKQLRNLGVKAGDSVSVTWDSEAITIRKGESA